MSLPTINVPTYELGIPSTKEKIQYRPFLVKEEKILLLANESQDDIEMINAIKQIITNCTFGKLDIEALAMFDLEYMFLRIRAKSVGEIAKLQLLCDDDGDTYAEVEVNLDEVEVDFPQKHTNKIQLTDEIGILMRYPKFNMLRLPSETSETEYVFKMIKECIGQVFEGETVHERSDFNEKDLDTFLDSLTSDHFKMLQEFFETMPKLSHQVKFKNPVTKKQNKQTLEGLQAFFV